MAQELTFFSLAGYLWKVVLFWWWIPAFFFAQKLSIYYWTFWRTNLWFSTLYKPGLMEVKLPKEIAKPVKAMESVLASIHGALYDPPEWWDMYVGGRPQTGVSLDIVSIGGDIHFYIRCHADFRDQVEAAVYSQYPEAEIEAVPDYAKQVPMDIPNQDTNMYGWDFQLAKDEQYPLKTYEDFESPGEKEEEKVDPMASLMEGLAKIKPGEQMWIQMRSSPVYDNSQKSFVKKGEALRDKLAFRKEKAGGTPLWKWLFDLILYGPREEKEEKQELIPLEMKLTPGERDTILAIEKKISKPIFRVGIRVLYMGKREIWFKENYRLALNFYNNFNSSDLNSLVQWDYSTTRVKMSPFIWMNYIHDRLEYVKKRHLFRVYRDRDNYRYPFFNNDKGRFILSVEEMATLYHFPSLIVSPTPGLRRTEAKETVAPHNLPI